MKFIITEITNTEIIRKCELHLYRRKLWHISKAERKHPHFHMIKISSTAAENFISERSLSSKGFGWVQFDVTTAVKHLFSRKPFIKEMMLDFSVVQVKRNTGEVKFEFVFNKNDVREPILIVYTDEKRNSLVTGKKGKIPKNYVSLMARSRSRSRVKRSENCQRKDMWIETQKLLWDFILQPEKFNAYRCDGTCSASPSGLKTNHAIIQAYISELTSASGQVTSPCCSPLKLEPRTFLMVDKQTKTIKMQEFSNIAVTSCACL